jgi:Fis family transcriptional regulator
MNQVAINQVPTLADRLASAVSEMRCRGIEFRRCVIEVKRFYLIAVLKANHGNVSRAAREIGMHRNSMIRMLDEFHIDAMRIRMETRPAKKRPQSAIAANVNREALG